MKWMLSFYRKESGSTLVLCLVLFLECYCVIARSYNNLTIYAPMFVSGGHGTHPRFAN